MPQIHHVMCPKHTTFYVPNTPRFVPQIHHVICLFNAVTSAGFVHIKWVLNIAPHRPRPLPAALLLYCILYSNYCILKKPAKNVQILFLCECDEAGPPAPVIDEDAPAAAKMTMALLLLLPKKKMALLLLPKTKMAVLMLPKMKLILMLPGTKMKLAGPPLPAAAQDEAVPLPPAAAQAAGLPGEAQDEDGPSATVQDENGPPAAAQDDAEPPPPSAAAQDEDSHPPK